jgi:hypothetical protein
MAFGRTEVLEFDDVSLFKMEQDAVTHVPTSISGLCGKSAYSVYDISSVTDRGVLLVRAKIHVARTGESGRFTYKLDITPDVNELRFGDQQHLLWKRS